jgi:hypothetical protein
MQIGHIAVQLTSFEVSYSPTQLHQHGTICNGVGD